MNTSFGVGNVLATGFRIWIKNFVPFMLITALIYSPLLLWGILSVQGDADAQYAKLITFHRYAIPLLLLLTAFVAAALTYGVVRELQGQRASVGACISNGFARFFPLLGVAVLVVLCIVGGWFAFFLPGVIAMCMFYVATTAVVIERLGVWAALKRSIELTRGHRIEIFGLLVILGGVFYGLTRIVNAVTLPHAGDPAYYERFSTYEYVSLARILIFGSISSALVGVTYYFLRAEKEGTNAEELARVFD